MTAEIVRCLSALHIEPWTASISLFNSDVSFLPCLEVAVIASYLEAV